ncbi:MAG: lysozyme [Clostridiales bacterium]|nr:lysozyme [Clostridiales bacterium]
MKLKPVYQKGIVFLLCFLFLIPAKPMEAKTSETKGIDVSGDYNGVVDWEAVAAQGYTFAMIRIAEGQAPDVDSQFEANYEGAKAAGLKVGVYHDCCIRTPEAAALEAAYCLELLDGRPLDYPVAYDMEKPGTFLGGIDNSTAIAKTYCDIIAEAGYTPMIYSNAFHLTNDFNWETLIDVKVWVAHYGVDETTFSGSYDLWQYSDQEYVEGANNSDNHCDVNYSFLEAETLTFDEDAITLGIGEAYESSLSITPSGCTDTITYTSSDASIADVDDAGQITASKKGTATITAESGSGLTSQITVTVKKAPKSVSLSISKKTLVKTNTYQIKPKLATSCASNQITYTSSDKKIASVNSSGLVKAKRSGTALITITTYNGKSTTLKIVVK